MRLIRVGLPALVGCLFLVFGITTLVPGMQSGEPGELAAVLLVAVIPLAIGVVLLLASVTALRRTRFGYVLGLTVGLLMAAGGLAAIAAEIPYLQEGGLSGSLGVGVVVLAVVWTIVWLFYAWRFSKSKSAFAPTWTPEDRRIAVVVVMVAAATFLGAAALQSNIAASSIQDGASAPDPAPAL